MLIVYMRERRRLNRMGSRSSMETSEDLKQPKSEDFEEKLLPGEISRHLIKHKRKLVLGI